MDEMSKNMSFEYGDDPKFREQETGHVYFETGVDESTEPFAKNVKLEAHTEYTSHVNGKIGESGGGDGSMFWVYTVLSDGPNKQAVATVPFEDAKNAYFENKSVWVSVPSNDSQTALAVRITNYLDDYSDSSVEHTEALVGSMGGANLYFLATNDVFIGS